LTLPLLFALAVAADPGLAARDAQDRPALDKLAVEAEAKASAAPKDPAAQHRAALVALYRAEVAIEVHDKNAGRAAAEAGIKLAEKAVHMAPANAEYHRVLGSLCGQAVAGNAILGLKHGRCAMEEVTKATELDPKSSDAWLSHGVGNYYLPSSFGGGFDLALKDIQKAIELNPKNADAHLWLGLTLRKLNHDAEARKALEEALKLNPGRVWAKQQLDKTPAK